MMDGIESAYVEMYTRRNFDLDFDVCDNNLLSMFMSICQRMTTMWRARCIRLIGNVLSRVQYSTGMSCR